MIGASFRAWFVDEMIHSDCPSGEFQFEFNNEGELEFFAWNDEKHELTPDGDHCYPGWDFITNDVDFRSYLKDINGIYIYENDIIKTKFDVYLVTYSEMGFELTNLNANAGKSFRCDLNVLAADMIVVIGNKYANPELLIGSDI